MRKVFAGIVGVALAAGAGTVAPSAPGFVEHFNAARQAHEAKNYELMERELRAALALRPSHPAALYELAAALALRGDPPAALEALDTLAKMGLSFDPSREADFASLGGQPRWSQILARFERNRAPAGSASASFRIFIPTFIPEGLAYDGDTGSYYVGGAHERRIQRVTRAGTTDNFVLPGAGGLLAPLGLLADSRRRLLWVASAGIPEMKNAQADELGRAGIIAYDLDNGRVKRRSLLPEDGRKHRLDALVLGTQGMIYATDSAAGLIYRFDTARGQYTALTRPGELISPRGVALSDDKKTLYIADYTQGLYAYELDGGRLSRLDVAPDICVYGIEGLYVYDGGLLAVQNGIRPHRVVRFRLDETGRRVQHARVLAANLPEFDQPAQGVVVGRRFIFIANSQWNRFDQDHKLPPEEQLRSPVVLRLALDRDG